MKSSDLIETEVFAIIDYHEYDAKRQFPTLTIEGEFGNMIYEVNPQTGVLKLIESDLN